jgi:hypothetical protein
MELHRTRSAHLSLQFLNHAKTNSVFRNKQSETWGGGKSVHWDCALPTADLQYSHPNIATLQARGLFGFRNKIKISA